MSSSEEQNCLKKETTKYCLNVSGSGRLVQAITTKASVGPISRQSHQTHRSDICKSVSTTPRTCYSKNNQSRTKSKRIPGIIATNEKMTPAVENKADVSEATNASTQIGHGCVFLKQRKRSLIVPKAIQVSEFSVSPGQRSVLGGTSGAISSPKSVAYDIGTVRELIQKSIEGSSGIREYWKKKEEIIIKYHRILCELDSEEAQEIVHVVSHLQSSKKDGTKEKIRKIREEYERTKMLIQKQRLIELEELVSGFQKCTIK